MKITGGATEPLINVSDCPRPTHVAPFQPSPNESVIVSVHVVEPITMPLTNPEKGLPPESTAPLLQESTQPTSPGYMPPDTVIVPGGGGGGGGGGFPAVKVTGVGPEPEANVSDCPSPTHVAPFQPSPKESVMVSVHVVRPISMPLTHPEKGLPPDSVVPLLHESDQLTSPGYMPPDTVIICAPGDIGIGGGGDAGGFPAVKLAGVGPEPLINVSD